VTTLPMAIPDAEISAVRFLAICCDRTTGLLYSKSVWRSE